MKYNLEFIKKFIKSHSKYVDSDGWFFPSDLAPHQPAFKYTCKKLYEQGVLERRGDKSDRWGYQYKLKL